MFWPNDAYRVIKFAWPNGYAVLEPCDSGFSGGYYSHYHPYYRTGLKIEKRYVMVGGEETLIHGFYGYPW